MVLTYMSMSYVLTNLKIFYKNLPFNNIDLEQDGTKYLVTFLESKPEKSQIDLLSKYTHETETVIFKNNAFYLYCPNGYGKTKALKCFN